MTAYEAALPDDGGTARGARSSRSDVERFAAAFFKWNGGSNFTDNPRVKVQRLAGGEWTRLRRPVRRDPGDARVPAGRGRARATSRAASEWHWTAHFEAFASNFDTIEGVARDARGHLPLRGRRPAPRRAAGRSRTTSSREPFRGRAVGRHHRRGPARRARPGGSASRSARAARSRSTRAGPTIQAEIGPIDYPDSYASPARFINDAAPGVPRPGGARRPGRSSSGTASLLVPALGRHRAPRARMADGGPLGRHAGADAGPAARRPVLRQPAPEAGRARLRGGRRRDRRLRERERSSRRPLSRAAARIGHGRLRRGLRPLSRGTL